MGCAGTPVSTVEGYLAGMSPTPVDGEFRICRHHPRVQDELSQSFDFPIFKRGNQNSNRAIQRRMRAAAIDMI